MSAPTGCPLPLSWRVAPIGRAIDDAAATALDFAVEGAALRPLSPVHVRGKRAASGDVVLTWIRRTRVSGDGWEQLDVPLGEDAEGYELDILDAPDGAVVRTLRADQPRAIYAATDQSADFGAPPNEIHLSLSQISARTGRGTARRTTIHV